MNSTCEMYFKVPYHMCSSCVKLLHACGKGTVGFICFSCTLSSQDVTLWMILYMCVQLVTVFVASIDTSSSGVAREPPPSVVMYHPGGVLTTGE